MLTHHASIVLQTREVVPPNPPYFYAVQACFESIPHHASIVFANGLAAPPPAPPMKACFKACEYFETHHASIVLANGGRLRSPPPNPSFCKPCKHDFANSELLL